MSEENKIEPLIRKEWEDKISQRDARITELETQLQALEKTHASQKKRSEKLEVALKDLQATVKATPVVGSGITVAIDGVAQAVIGDFRADNTFAEVKRGHCPEGVTLVAIDRPH